MLAHIKNILITQGFILINVLFVLYDLNNSSNKKIESLKDSETPEIDNLSDLYKLEEFESDLTTFTYFLLSVSIFYTFRGRTLLEGMKN